MSAKKKGKKPASAAPYRGGPAAPAESAPSDRGLVDDLIRQFADRFAFFRELVQNSIDAGATSIHVQLAWEPAPEGELGTMRVSVRDDGAGMTREILENDLTVLFKSTKESRDDAIGKFGIGFVSVLAVEPEVVIVDTSTGDGTRWSLHLHGDQTYDLFRADTGAGRGTTVTLVVPLPDPEEAAFVERSEAALKRWCRHTRVPIRFVALGADGGDPRRDVRIDEPMTVDAVVSVHARSRDGLTTVVAGLPRAGDRYGAFFNQGLLLHETRDHELGEVIFKVSDARLEHTLSRDDVRRDEHYARAVELVATTIRGPLLDELAEQLANASEAFARGGRDAGARIVEILDAFVRSELPAPRRALVLPAITTGRDRKVARMHELSSAFVSHEGRTPLAEALAAAGHVVVDLSFAPDDAARERVTSLLARVGGDAPPRDRACWSLIVPIEPTDADVALLASVSERLDHVVRRPSEILLAEVHGAASEHLAFATSPRATPWLARANDHQADPFRLLMRPPLVLRADHPIVHAARARAEDAPVLASALLARAILVARGALTPSVDASLTERALRDALGDAR
ncbi:ATP-binding protein [Sandaracinus amylolyticus]|uniref:Putative heat shock protein n=1 Tax=Sandaracinus amylolyticus TaxID=927083 RepID=A0A0F6W7X2_9BACT|nr:ATP-binding protein [Sandaracinus amylolyticus]AKF09686.1 putative heat shock protein [Sandaracinus amylolyticus]